MINQGPSGPFFMPIERYPHIAQITVVYRTADGGCGIKESRSHKGTEDWSAQDWLELVCATSYVKANWLTIEVTRTQPRISNVYQSPKFQLERLINPPESESCD